MNDEALKEFVDGFVDFVVNCSDKQLQIMIDKATSENQLYIRDVLLLEQHNRIKNGNKNLS